MAGTSDRSRPPETSSILSRLSSWSLYSGHTSITCQAIPPVSSAVHPTREGGDETHLEVFLPNLSFARTHSAWCLALDGYRFFYNAYSSARYSAFACSSAVGVAVEGEAIVSFG